MYLADKISKKRCADPGEPNKSLVFAKLESPTLSWGIRIRITKIRNRLINIPNVVNIILIL